MADEPGSVGIELIMPGAQTAASFTHAANFLLETFLHVLAEQSVTAASISSRQLVLDVTVPGDEFEVDDLLQSAKPIVHSVPVISLFSGAGFLDLGFEAAGFRVVYRNEYDKVFAEAGDSAREGMRGPGQVKADQRSIVEIGPSELLKKAFGGARAPRVFGLIGGPPCPDFSVGGKNRGGSGDRGKLTEVFVERVLEVLPTFFVLENVKGLISTKKHREFLNGLKARLSAQYVLHERVLNALDFGVPQDRERVFVVGVMRSRKSRRSSTSGVGFAWPHSEKYAGAKQRYEWPSTAPFGALLPQPPGIPRELTVWGTIGDSEGLRRLPNGEDMFFPWSGKFHEIAEGDDHRKSFKRLHRWRYSPTVAYGNNEVHLHPTEPRRISVREALRLQSVPDSFAFPEGTPLSAMFKMVGNGVPVKLAHAVALSVGRAISEMGE